MKRLGACIAAVALAAVCGVGTAAAQIRSVDLRDYPLIRVTLTTSSATTPPAPPRENGAPVQGVQVQNLGEQKAVIVAIDRSQSMRGAPLAAATRAAESFVDTKSQSDFLEVLAFGYHALALSQYSEATIDADTALRSIAVDSHPGTALYDAVTTAAANAARAPVDGRVLILLTDGQDVGSFSTYDDAVTAAKRTGLIIFGIALGHGSHSQLRALADATGGQLYRSASPATLSSIYQQIRRDLARTWLISYATTARPGDQIRVGVDGHELALVMPGHRVVSHRRTSRLEARWTILPVAVIAGILLALAWGVLGRSVRTRKLKERVAMAAGDLEPAGSSDRGRAETIARPALELLARALRGTRALAFLERSVDRAAIKLRAVELAALSLILGVALAVILATRGTNPLVWIAGLVLGACVPPTVVWFMGRRRVRQFDTQLPVLLETIAASLRAGHSLRHAINGIAADGSPPASVEFGRVLAEARLGRPLEEAMIAMCERLGSPDLEYVAGAVAVQANVGGSMAGLFDQAAETVRHRQQHARKLRTLTATGRASAATLAVLPIALAVFLTLVNPSYMLPFFEDPTGQMLCVICLISMAIGGLILLRIVTVKE